MAKKPTIPPAKKTSVSVPIAQKTKNKITDSPKNKAETGWWPLVIAVLLITALCYLPSLSNGLVNWDDDPNITDNPNLARVEREGMFSTFADIFSLEKGHVIGGYNPLSIFTFAIEKSLAGGFNTTLIHTTNLLLHLIAVFFVMRLLVAVGINRWGAALGGLLFGIHPMRVESVAWATERKDVLFGAFFFAALVYYVRWVKTDDRAKKWTLYLATFVLAILSDLSKVQGVTLVLSMLTLDYLLERPLQLRLIWEKIPFFALAIFFGSINIYTLRLQGTMIDDVTNFTFVDRLCIGAYSFCVYLYKLIFPFPMSPLYPYPKPLPIWVYLAPIGFFGVAALTVLAWIKNRRIWVFGVLFFLFNVMFLLQIFGAGQGFLADRFTYVPYFGFFAIAAWYFGKMAEDASKRTSLLVGVGILSVLYGVFTVKQVGIWKNGDTLWSHVMKYEGEKNSLPFWNRGQYRRNILGNYDAALQDYTKAVTIEPKNPELYNSRGKTYFDMAMSGKYPAQLSAEYREKALSDYGTALTLPGLKNKSKSEILINRGAAFGSKGMLQEALQSLNQGIAVEPDNKNGYFNRSIVYYNLQQYDSALVDYRNYLRYDPYNANIWYESGTLLRAQQKNSEAMDAFNHAIKFNPNFGLAYLERARVYIQAGDKVAAQRDYQRAQQLGQKLTPSDTQMLSN